MQAGTNGSIELNRHGMPWSDGEKYMKLGLADTSASPAAIEAGCAAALALMTARNVTPEAAYKAVMSRSNRERRFDRHAARAWDDAEDEAIRVAYGGKEPQDDPVLIPIGPDIE
jgi:hypothetical protein